jgi:hypothetical protein
MATDKSKYKPRGRRKEGARYEVCRECGLDWNIAKTAELPEAGYICPRCRYKNRKAKTNGKK